MKFSEMSSDRAADVLCEISLYLDPIVTDEEFIKFLQDKIVVSKNASKFELYGMGLKKVNAIIPILLKNHKEDVFSIVAVMNEKTYEDVKKQNLIKTLAEIKDILQDKDLISFFRSCAAQDQNER